MQFLRKNHLSPIQVQTSKVRKLAIDKRLCKCNFVLYFSSEKEVYPRFVVQFHNDHYVLDERVRQPTDVKIFAAQLFIFKTPVQNEDSIRDIYLSGGKIFLEVYRPKDRQSSSVKHEFEFKVHTSWRNSSIEWCAFCLENPDKIGQSMEESLKHRLQSTGKITNPCCSTFSSYLISDISQA